MFNVKVIGWAQLPFEHLKICLGTKERNFGFGFGFGFGTTLALESHSWQYFADHQCWGSKNGPPACKAYTSASSEFFLVWNLPINLWLLCVS